MRAALAPLLLLALILHAEEEWSRFRGPNGSGIAPAAAYPIEFGPNKNLLWRTPLRPGKSSPVLTAKHIFLTGFADKKGHDIYQDHPLHDAFRKECAHCWMKVVIYDSK